MAKKASEQEIKAIFGRGVGDVIGRERLEQALKEGVTLRFKMGMDPTSPDLHLGHAVGLRILRKLQDLGHEITVIVGDYTARIGDPSGRSKTRPPLEGDRIDANAKTYLSQVGKILDVDKIELRINSEWLSKLSFAELIKLASHFTVARTLERDDFAKRYKEGVEIYLHEMLYPLMQAYDSVAIDSDVEIGGTDQTFNMLAGRELQKKLGKNEQAVISVPLLVGLYGTQKMSKSLGNYIGLTEDAKEMYGKIMSIPDSLIVNYFELATGVSDEEIAGIRSELSSGANPRDLKMRLGREIVALYHSQEEAIGAEEAFVKTFRKKELPDEIPEKNVEAGKFALSDLLYRLELVPSKTEARRVIEQGGIRIDGKVVNDPSYGITVGSVRVLIQKGKRVFVNVCGK
jgi:tyrosyl-tRNA synthetase